MTATDESASEAIERAALQDLHAMAPAPVRTALGIRGVGIGTAYASVAGALPASAIVINRVIGLGTGAPAREHDVRAIVDAYAAAGVARYFVHLHPQARPPELTRWLGAAGLERARGWQKFERGTEPVPDASTDLDVREVGREHGPAFARIVCDAFDLGSVATEWLSQLPGRDGWRVVMSFDGDVPAGCGALFVRGDAAWTDFGATAAAYRRRGSQGAVLARRIALALEHGCRRLFTCTGEAVPGDPQHSYSNILRAGFRESYVRANYALPRP